MKKKRLCIVYWDLGPGGIQKRIRDLLNYFGGKTEEYDIYVLLRRKTDFGFDAQVSPSPAVKIRYYPLSGTFRPPLGFIFWAAWQYVHIRPSVVLTFQSLLSATVVIYKYAFFWIPVRVVLNEGAVTSRALKIDHAPRLGVLIRLFYPYADRIIVPTLACKKDLISNYSIPDKSISIVANWTLFKATTPLSPQYDILFVGRFSQEKNPLFMINLAKNLRMRLLHVKIAMLGSGDMQSVLRKKIEKEHLEKTVTILPFSDDVKFYLRRSKILVVPSKNEGMPNVVLEASMVRIPSIIANFPGAHEVVEQGKTGYVYGTLQECLQKSCGLLVDTKLRRRMGIAAQKNAGKKFSAKTQAKFIELLW